MLYCGSRRRRTDLIFNPHLRELTRDAARRLHLLIESRVTPIAQREKKCESCSFLNICLPEALRLRRGAASWFEGQLKEALDL